ncbi:MAG: helix-turn-helix domain-containing protein, partial [Planctomycetota bacterium]
AELLRQTDLPVKAIAVEVGMADLQRFNKAFRRSTGVSPRAYRVGKR